MSYRYGTRYTSRFEKARSVPEPERHPEPEPAPRSVSRFGQTVKTCARDGAPFWLVTEDKTPEEGAFLPEPEPLYIPPVPRTRKHKKEKYYWSEDAFLLRAIMELSAKPLHDGQAGIFLFELQEQERKAYKPPPIHWRQFSKMQPSDADPTGRRGGWPKGRPRKQVINR